MTAQLTSWRAQISVLKDSLSDVHLTSSGAGEWGIAMEFVIPRRMGRIDVVLLVRDAIVGLEFKTQSISSSAADQIEDYCLDLLNFHSSSHARTIYPVVVGTGPVTIPKRKANVFRQLEPTRFINATELSAFLLSVVLRHSNSRQIPIQIWREGEYRPVPTIVEAAIGMFAEMEVDDIARADCDPINLTATASTIRRIAIESMNAKRRTVCFVTGVPGAGKTLAGLKIVHDRELRDEVNSNSVFLTGNLPLVKVLRAALGRDAARRKKERLRVTSRDPKTTIDTILGYKRTHTRSNNPPNEKIVIFDEAQRAWTAERTAEYLEQTDQWTGYSEPELLMAILDRHDWAVLVALVGGGQEINRGEAGLGEWGRALSSRFRHWSIAASQEALDGAYGAGARLFEGETPPEMNLTVETNLHLDNPTRQFRGKTVARWAEALLEGNAGECLRILQENSNYPIYFTRDLNAAKEWLRSVAHGTERYGCIASSEARRLRAEGLELPPARADGVEHWFLAPNGDVRSSYQLEVAANEFQIQGLEIDWACVCWGGDFIRQNPGWFLRRFRGTRWQAIGQPDACTYVVNTYRVLLTRARQGMVIFVPAGANDDLTRAPDQFEGVATFLLDCGVQPLPD
jgi:Uncharacterized conserved protein (DUF2075)